MITICLDECGNFEMENNVFIGGAVYTGIDYEEEKIRINNYLKDECEKCGGSFPKDLHRNYNNTNSNIVRKIKENISNSIGDYLRTSGKYHIVCMLTSKKGRADLKNKSNILDDDIASNRYEHMACNTINNLIFNNLLLKDEEKRIVNLEVATRMAVIPVEEKDKIKSFEDLGYKKKTKIKYFNKESIGFYATDEKTYKTSTSSLMMYKGRENVNFNKINVQPMIYDEKAESMEFLYLADFLCNNINENFDNEENKSSIQTLYNWGKKVTGGNEPFIWVYDEIDGIYNTVMDNFYKNDIFELLSCMYDGIVHTSEASNFYNKVWFNAIRKKLFECCRDNYLELGISKLEYYLISNDLIQDKAVFIFQGLCELINIKYDEAELKNKNRLAKEKYRLANAGIAVFNHKGDVKKTEEFLKECEELKKHVDIELYLDTVNRISVIYADKFDFDKAYELAEYNAESLKILKQAKKDIAQLNNIVEKNTYLSNSLGKALSSCGQYLAFKRDTNALIKFEETLTEFQGDNANTMITLSYILHYAIDRNNQELYKKYCDKYFNGFIDLNDQFEYIISGSMRDVNKNYSMYVFIKALNKFYSNEINSELLQKIRETNYKEKGFNIGGHPWELIYKHIGILLYNKNLNKLAQKFMMKAYNTIIKPQTTIIAINYLTKMQEAYYEDSKKDLIKLIKEFNKWTEENGLNNYFSECFEEENNKVIDIYEKINNKFTYTYA